MSFPPLRITTLYQRDLRNSKDGVEEFAPLRDPSPFICKSAALSSWSNTKGMQI
jgi:hypothetical protein